MSLYRIHAWIDVRADEPPEHADARLAIIRALHRTGDRIANIDVEGPIREDRGR